MPYFILGLNDTIPLPRQITIFAFKLGLYDDQCFAHRIRIGPVNLLARALLMFAQSFLGRFVVEIAVFIKFDALAVIDGVDDLLGAFEHVGDVAASCIDISDPGVHPANGCLNGATKFFLTLFALLLTVTSSSSLAMRHQCRVAAIPAANGLARNTVHDAVNAKVLDCAL
ncbi:MAG: hypothetical protein TEF_21980 [Rhizobiales bacterium NRL2]|nr:MAG: hypothetical protein TEF_21980 [Rhizobiales bacterium NRL2]